MFIALISVSVFAGFDEGLNAYKRDDYATALKEWQPLADQGDASAQYSLGRLYEYGMGVLLDSKQAADWYRKAADQGNANAQHYLGFMYNYGRGVPQDNKQAAVWYRKAAVQGNSSGQKALGLFYKEGISVNKNLIVAYAWLNLAATAGHPNAPKERAELALQLSADELIQAQKLSSDWKVGQSIPEPKNQAKLKPTKKVASTKEATTKDKSFKSKSSSNATTKYTSCQNSCINGDCVRTFPDGKTERWQAPQVFDPFTSSFKWDTSSCG